MLFMQTPTGEETLEQGDADHQVWRAPPVGRQQMQGEKLEGKVVGLF